MRFIVFLAVILTLGLSYGLLSLKFLDHHQVIVPDDAFISATFPKLKGARLSRTTDLKDIFLVPFKLYGYSFWLKGDFNQDGYTDYFISGQFQENGKQKPFFALVVVKGKRVIVEVLNTQVSDTLMLKEMEPGKIIAAYALNSNDFYLIYWDGKAYKAHYAGNPGTMESQMEKKIKR